jgi:hypothetical protein
MTTHTRQHDIDLLEPRTLLAGDLAVLSVTPSLSFNNGLKDRLINAAVTVQNVGDEAVRAGLVMTLFLSRNDTLDIGDYRILQRSLPRLFNPGVTVNYNFAVRLPGDFAGIFQAGNLNPGDYKIIAQITPRTPAEDTNASNNTLVSQTTVPVRYDFGRTGEGTNSRVIQTFLGFDNAITFRINGPGRGEVLLEDGRIVVRITGTTDRSSVVMTTPRFFSGTINELEVQGDLNRLEAKNVNITGDITISGTVSRVRLQDVSNSSFVIGATGKPAYLSLRSATNVSLDSQTPFKTVTTDRWVTTDSATDVIIAPYISTLRINGAINVELSLTGAPPRGPTLGNAVIGGSLTGRWNINGDVRLIRGETINNFRVNVAGSLNNITSRGNFSGTVAAQTLNLFFIRGNVNNTNVFIGANLGADVALGGTGPAADSFAPGEIRRINIGGGVENSIFVVGLDPVDGGIFNGDDRFVDSDSRIRSITVRGEVGSSSFAGPVLPLRALINGRVVHTADDIRFTDTL